VWSLIEWTLQAATVGAVEPVDHALERVRSWPVPNVVAGVRRPDGTTVVVGNGARPFPLASVTKLLTAAAVLVAVEEGSLGLDDPVEMPPGATVRDLLCHASGLAPDRDEPVARPRRRRVYSNRGYELLGERVAAATGMDFPTYLHEAVAEPLGLVGTSLTGSAASGGIATVDDLLVLAAALDPAGPSPLLAVETRTALRTPQYPELDGVLPGYGSQSPNPWGLGPEIRGTKSPHWTGRGNSPATFGHFGRAGTFLWVDPVAQLTLVVLTDRDFGEWCLTAWPSLADAVLTAEGRDGTIEGRDGTAEGRDGIAEGRGGTA
jgi:CubicO group peptidase (beta-lactamase class C family)